MSAWIGIVIGGALGGLAGAILTKKLLHHTDIGVTGAAAACGALAGGFLTSAPVAASTTPTMARLPMAYTIPLDKDFNALVHLYDTVTLAPPAGVTITNVVSNGSTAISDQGNYTYEAVKLGGALLQVGLSDGSSRRIKIEVQ